jgi:hypothetical protein
METQKGDIFKNQSGAALVIALIMIIVMTLIVLAASFTSTFEIKLAGNKRSSTDAFYAADTGVQIVMAKVENFDLPGKYVGEKYNPFIITDPSNPDYNPNPTNAKAVVEHSVNQKGAPRGFGTSAIYVDFEHYLIESTGQDTMQLSPIKSTCTIQQKVVRIVPLP